MQAHVHTQTHAHKHALTMLASTPAPTQVICTKVRDGDKRIVQIKEGNPKGRHVVIVDDLVQSGGTLIECHAVLAKAGAKHGKLAALLPGASPFFMDSHKLRLAV